MPDVLIPGMQDQPERRYSYAGKRAHLLAYGVDYSAAPYTQAYCGWSPNWPGAWLGSGNQTEADLAELLPLCKRCAAVAAETAAFLAGLISDATEWKTSGVAPGVTIANRPGGAP